MKALFSISSIFSLIFRHLGRDNNPTSLEISTYMRNIGSLGRETRPAGSWNLYPFRQFFAIWVEKRDRPATGISTYMRNIGGLGREMRPAGYWNLYLFRHFFAIWVEKISWSLYPFRQFFVIWVEKIIPHPRKSLPI